MIDIDKLLKEKRLSKTDLAKRMGINRVSLYSVLSGNPTLENINKLASALEVPVTDLFDDPKTDIANCPYCGGKIKVTRE